MGLFDKFPFSNMHQLNLDWILTKFRQFEKDNEKVVAAISGSDNIISKLEAATAEAAELEKQNEYIAGLLETMENVVIANGLLIEDEQHPGCLFRNIEVGESVVKEYLNPPLVVGYEYRTAKRFSGKPVFTKLFTFPTVCGNNNYYYFPDRQTEEMRENNEHDYQYNIVNWFAKIDDVVEPRGGYIDTSEDWGYFINVSNDGVKVMLGNEPNWGNILVYIEYVKNWEE